MVLGEAFHRQVVNRLAARLEKDEKHAMLIFVPENIRYVTGIAFASSDRPTAACVWSDRRVALFVPQLDAEFASTGSIRDIRWYAEYPGETSPIVWMAREAGGPLVVDQVSAIEWKGVQEEIEESEIADYVAELRLIKSQPEIDLIKRACDFSDLALERIFARLTSGSSERDALHEILGVIDTIMRTELGELYDPLSRPISGVLRSGTRAGYPHAPTSHRTLSRNDTVTVEFTASVAGYHAKSGATFFVGDPLRDVVRWVETSMAAQEAAREAMLPGATAEAVDQAARKVIERAGLSGMIRHRTGHGIGLSTHEAPWLVRAQTTTLRPGMVLVNQPGIYVTGRTGVRNCETIVIEEEAPRVLNPRIERWNTPEARLKEF